MSILFLFFRYSVCVLSTEAAFCRDVVATRQQNRTMSAHPSKKYIRTGPMAPARGLLNLSFCSCMANYYTIPARAPQPPPAEEFRRLAGKCKYTLAEIRPK